uniref:Uncharacterized protein n=1 Tax=Arundo donax TaxID=35708 RepID=A0A0A9DMX7_ARUDO
MVQAQASICQNNVSPLQTSHQFCKSPRDSGRKRSTACPVPTARALTPTALHNHGAQIWKNEGLGWERRSSLVTAMEQKELRRPGCWGGIGRNWAVENSAGDGAGLLVVAA